MEGYFGVKKDNSALMKLLSDNLSLSSSPGSNTSVNSGPRYLSSSDDSPLMRYLLSGKISGGGSTPVSRQFYNSSGGSGGTAGSSSESGGISSHRSSPFSAIENKERLPLASQLPPHLKIEEDVVVMDGILVEPVKRGGPRSRSSSTSSDSGGSRSSAYPSPGSFYKTEICRAWEVLGTCEFGLRCQFAHGQEELRPACLPNKSKVELRTGKSYASPDSCIRGPRHRAFPKASTIGAKEAVGATALSTLLMLPHLELKHAAGPRTGLIPNTNSPVMPKHNAARITPVMIASKEWSPLDDGIEVELMDSADKPPSRKAVDDHINSFLYGPMVKKRLPVFVDFCPE